jgi:PAS domain S-box-containing protein
MSDAEQMLRTILDSSPDSIIVTDLLGRVVECSQATLAMHGFTEKSQAIGRSCMDFVTPEDRLRAWSDLGRTLVAVEPQVGEFRVLRADGSLFFVEIAGSAIRGASGVPSGVVILVKDITERRRVQESLRHERDRAQNYLDIAGTMIVVLDADGNVSLINRRGCEILEGDEKDVLGTNWINSYLAEPEHEVIGRLFRDIICGAVPCPEYRENRIRTRTGRIRLIAWHNALLQDEAGRILGVICSGEDITDRRNAEAQVLTYQQQLRALASELALAEERERRRIATYLHDTIAQMLTTAGMKLDAILASPDASGVAAALAEIRGLLSRAIQNARSATFDLSPPVLHELGLTVALEWLTERFGAEHGLSADLVTEGPETALEEDLRVVLFQAARELLHNVAKHARARRAKVSLKVEDSRLSVTVEDDGRGFDVAEAMPNARALTGFGLFAIRERLAHFGGRMEIRSEPGRGTTAALSVPIRPNSGPLREKLHEH